MGKNFKVYIGWDSREDVAYKVLKSSIERQATIGIDVLPLNHRQLRKDGYFRRPWLTEADTGQRIDLVDSRPFSTEFSHTRFLVPELMNYEGWALFMDCDMIFTDDIKKLVDKCDDKYAVMVVKHNHRPIEKVKMDDQVQSNYHRKNWSSFVLWNCGHPANKQLTKELVNTRSGSWLHQFSWLDDYLVGHLGFEYNWIEGVSPHIETPSVIHYTLGGPWLENWEDVVYADIWIDEYERWQRNVSDPTPIPTIKYGG